jgi:hypothetical protein
MTNEIRWRIITLQIIMTVLFIVGAIIAFAAGNFTHDYVQTQLSQQKVSFPAKGDPALDPQKFPDLQQYAGQQVDDGPKAKAYANGFIGRHLQSIANGQTYSQVSAQAQANPSDTQLSGQTQTLFRGETLRALLLNAWGWWTVGTYALYAGIALIVAAVAVLGALVFELFIAPRRARAKVEAEKLGPQLAT